MKLYAYKLTNTVIAKEFKTFEELELWAISRNLNSYAFDVIYEDPADRFPLIIGPRETSIEVVNDIRTIWEKLSIDDIKERSNRNAESRLRIVK